MTMPPRTSLGSQLPPAEQRMIGKPLPMITFWLIRLAATLASGRTAMPMPLPLDVVALDHVARARDADPEGVARKTLAPM
jgi:hypothetical protein